MYQFNNKDSRVQQKTLFGLQQFRTKQKTEIQLVTEFGLSNLSDPFQNESKKRKKKEKELKKRKEKKDFPLVPVSWLSFLQTVYLTGSCAASYW